MKAVWIDRYEKSKGLHYEFPIIDSLVDLEKTIVGDPDHGNMGNSRL